MSDKAKLTKLQKLWYKKLARSGFKDIEDSYGSLTTWHSTFFRDRPNIDLVEAKAEYFRLAEHFLNDYSFEDEAEKLIWEMHSQGVGQRETIKELKRRKLRGHFDFVRATINRLVAEMKRRY